MADAARKRSKQPWHAVSVLPGGNACPHVLRLIERRFLCVQAPRLPLRECPFVATCTCTYRHHLDRRQGPRRSADETGRRTPPKGPERRAGRGRRQGDWT